MSRIKARIKELIEYCDEGDNGLIYLEYVKKELNEIYEEADFTENDMNTLLRIQRKAKDLNDEIEQIVLSKQWGHKLQQDFINRIADLPAETKQ